MENVHGASKCGSGSRGLRVHDFHFGDAPSPVIRVYGSQRRALAPRCSETDRSLTHESGELTGESPLDGSWTLFETLSRTTGLWRGSAHNMKHRIDERTSMCESRLRVYVCGHPVCVAYATTLCRTELDVLVVTGVFLGEYRDV